MRAPPIGRSTSATTKRHVCSRVPRRRVVVREAASASPVSRVDLPSDPHSSDTTDRPQAEHAPTVTEGEGVLTHSLSRLVRVCRVQRRQDVVDEPVSPVGTRRALRPLARPLAVAGRLCSLARSAVVGQVCAQAIQQPVQGDDRRRLPDEGDHDRRQARHPADLVSAARTRPVKGRWSASCSG